MYSKRKRANVVKDVKRIYWHENLFGALPLDKTFCRAGNAFAYQLALQDTARVYRIEGFMFGVFFAASELEAKTGFISRSAFHTYISRQSIHNIFKRLVFLGLLSPAPFPLQYSHIKRVCKNYTVTDKGRECISYFRREYMKHVKRERKRATVDTFAQ